MAAQGSSELREGERQNLHMTGIHLSVLAAKPCSSSPHNFGVEPCKVLGLFAQRRRKLLLRFLSTPFSQGRGTLLTPRNEQKDEWREKPFSTHKCTFIVAFVLFNRWKKNHSLLSEIWVQTAMGKHCQGSALCTQTPQVSHRPLPILH